MSEIEVQAFWKTMVSIADNADAIHSLGETPEHSVGGGIAVLVVLHSDWLKEEETREHWCADQFRILVENPPPRPDFDVASSSSDSYFRNFEAIIAISILKEDPCAVEIRRWCAMNLTGYSYSVAKDVMDFAFHWRAEFGSTFRQLQKLAVNAAGVRFVFETTKGGNSIFNCPNAAYDIDDRMDLLVDEFSAGETSDGSIDFVHVTSAATDQIKSLFLAERSLSSEDDLHSKLREKLERLSGFESDLIKAAFGWLERFQEIEEQTDRDQAVELMEVITSGLLRPLGSTSTAIADSQRDGEGFYRHPRDFENWWFSVLVNAIVHLDSTEQAKRLWLPLLSLGLDRLHWVEGFLSSWFIYGSRDPHDVRRFCEHWKEMIQFAWNQQNWLESPVRHNETNETLFIRLMGHLSFGESAVVDERLRSVVGSMQTEYEQWADRFLPHPEVVRAYAGLLAGDAFVDLRRKGIAQIAAATEDFNDWHWRSHYYLTSALLKLLEVYWRENQGSVIRDSSLRDDFTKVLKTMTDRQIPRALEMQDRLIRSRRSPNS
ncbi:hypothetical protein [Allorhodopirellula heiligendammensis]|nr:hypothetical protein [Allorhodopirellula heiligendammensis]